MHKGTWQKPENKGDSAWNYSKLARGQPPIHDRNMNTQRSSLVRGAIIVLVGITLACGPVTAAPAKLPPLTSVSGSPRLPGKFVWADLVTDNALVAQQFYTELFGWKFYDYGGYFIGMMQDRPLCGMFQRPRPKDRPASPRWFGYISVGNVAKAERAVTAAGGKVLAPLKNMPKRGEQAVFSDPEGALFGVIKSTSGDQEDFLAEPGEWIWMQLLSRDARKAADFYRAIAGYDVVENTGSNRASDFILNSEGFARATVRTIQSSNAKVQPTWLPFVRVKNVSESLEKAKQLGGKTLIEPKPDVLDGKVAVIADPTGSAIGIMAWEPGMSKGGR
jgi:predicted enzyme related to lactoylglutathione lyase